MKKGFFFLIIISMSAVIMSGVAFAHGGHGRKNHKTVQQPGYALCTVEDCKIVHSHKHDGNWYCGQAGLSGDYEVCKVRDCTEIGLHEHDGEYYHCQNYKAPACNKKNCHKH